ncbi:MAG: terminase small subunit [Ruminococcus sp.]|nr:terminase small subunit [Ruminococcus sp.]
MHFHERSDVKLTKDETAVRFCCAYVKLGNINEAAAAAGCTDEDTFQWGINILRKKKYRQLILQLRSIFSAETKDQVMCGLERLAFGSSADAVKLVLSEEIPDEQELKEMNLFNVSEIKKVKGGGVEVKFSDRQKALERLMEYAGNSDRSAAAKSLLNALAGADEDGV